MFNRRNTFCWFIVVIIFSFIVFTCGVVTDSWGEVLRGKVAHEKYLYPVVRVSTGYAGGSGTLVYSKGKVDKYSTYVLTNYHVIAEAVRITDEWDSTLKKKIPIERRSVVYVEIFKYRNLSVPVGTMKLEAEIVIYNRQEDMALLKLNYDEWIRYVAFLNNSNYVVMDEAVAVGCSMGLPPLVSVGVITRLNYLDNSLPYDMSSAQIIFGNSGGAMFNAVGDFIGIPSMVAMQGWSSAIPHMGLFIPWKRVAIWLESEHYDFIYNKEKIEEESLRIRGIEIEAKINGGKQK